MKNMMENIKAKATDGRLLNLLRIGESVKDGSNKITCSNKDGEPVELTFDGIPLFSGITRYQGLKWTQRMADG